MRAGLSLMVVLAVGLSLSAAAAAENPGTVAPASTAPPEHRSTAPDRAPAPAAPTLRWDYLPVVGYLGDTLWFSLRVGAVGPWTVRTNAGPVVIESGSDHQTVDCHLLVPSDGSALHWIEFSAPGQRRLVHLVPPGGGAQLTLDQWHRLALHDEPVVLIVDRTEPDRDRRWRPVRFAEVATAMPCAITVEATRTATDDGGILSALVNAQSAAVAGSNALVLVPSADQSVGWKHREYRQVLAWLVSDLFTRHATHVVLVDPIAPAVERPDLQPLITQVKDVAEAYHCRVVGLHGLGEDRYWQIAPGILGTSLNAQGTQALADALAPWRPGAH